MKQVKDTSALGIVKLAWPAMLDYFLITLLSLVDLFFVSKLGSQAVATVGVGWPVMFVINSLAMSLGTGTAAVVAHHVGAGKTNMAKQAIASAVMVFSLVIFLLSLVFAALAGPIYSLFAVDAGVKAMGTVYLSVLMPFLGLRAIYFMVAYSLRAGGDMKTPLAMSATALAVGLLSDALLIPKMHVFGAGLAHGAVSTSLGLFALAALFFGQGVRPGDAFRGLRQIPTILKISWPAIAEQLVMRVGFLGFTRLVTGLGTVAIAAHILAVRLEALSFMPAVGFGAAAGTLAGQHLGAGQAKEASFAVARVVKMGMGIMTVFGFLLIILASGLTGIFSPEPGVRELAILLITVAAVEQPAFGLYMPYLWAIRVTGWTKGALGLAAVGSFVTRVPLGYFFGYVLGWGVVGVWFGGILDWYIRGILAMFAFRWGRWKKVWKRVPPEPCEDMA